MTRDVLITGSSGLIGRHLTTLLRDAGYRVRGLDIRADGAWHGDITDPDRLAAAVAGCCGIVHLAAISRVVWGQRDPERCWATNVGALQHLIELALAQPTRPWLLFSSSREVYGQAARLPVDESMSLNPLNVYARSKVEGERLVLAARDRGLRTAVVRLSNVYGCTRDHSDRVIPAFARQAVMGETLRVDGSNHTFDFTHVDDVVRGIGALVGALEADRDDLPPIHLVTGQPTTLGQLAALSLRLSASDAAVVEAPPRSYDVERFHGDPGRARALLGWETRIPLEDGLRRLIDAFRAEQAPGHAVEDKSCTM